MLGKIIKDIKNLRNVSAGVAVFVKHPRRYHDLFYFWDEEEEVGMVEQEKAYEMVKAIWLKGIDYKNFLTDMRVERQFLEDNLALCSTEKRWKCLLVRKRWSLRGVLVMPEEGGRVGWAAARWVETGKK